MIYCAAAPANEEIQDRERALVEPLLMLAKALGRWDHRERARLWVITTGAQAALRDDPAPDPAAASLWGFGRALAREFPECWGGLIDLESQPADASLAMVRSIVEQSAGDDQIAIRKGRRPLALRLSPAGHKAEKRRRVLPPVTETDGYLLDAGPRKTLDDLVFRARARRPPGAGEVEVSLHAAGLNFRDVLNALGQYPGDAGLLGFESVGTVLRVGDGVRRPLPGDEVIVIGAPGSMASHLTVDARFAIPKPAGMSFEEATTIPATFLTAYYALHVLGRMQRGDRVLIHAAAGGVGLAAVQLAQRAGAEVFATAGSPEKRDYLRSLGVRHLFHSRTLDFADEVRAASGGQGVTMVLNSLNGEFIAKSFEVLAPGGRFLEMGKIGIWDRARVEALDATFEYYPFDLAVLPRENPDLVLQMMRHLLQEFESGALRPLPITVFPLDEAEDAFRFMAQARHIGKVVLSRAGELRRGRAARLRPDATYLITGGLGALGLKTARWLSERGARHMILAGRHAPGAAAQAVIDELRSAGAEIRTVQLDVSRSSDVERFIESLEGRRCGACSMPLDDWTTA